MKLDTILLGDKYVLKYFLQPFIQLKFNKRSLLERSDRFNRSNKIFKNIVTFALQTKTSSKIMTMFLFGKWIKILS